MRLGWRELNPSLPSQIVTGTRFRLIANYTKGADSTDILDMYEYVLI
jgi:hypothetical protein